jgi:hypothetical protein
MRVHLLTSAVVLTVLCVTARAQWLDYPTKGIPRTRDGKPNLAAPAPRTASGVPDLSGIWQAASDPGDAAGGIEGIVAPKYQIDVMRDLKGAVPFQPWAEQLFNERQANKLRDNPMIKCLPAGVPRLNAYTHPYKIVQTPGLMVMLYESDTMFRQVFTDGRALPKDPEPSWLGYSVGRWDGDVFVVESMGFNDKTWLDGLGHPHSEALRLTERFHRRTLGEMDVDITINDPKAYTKPIRYVQLQRLFVDTELIEYICNENAKPVGP